MENICFCCLALVTTGRTCCSITSIIIESYYHMRIGSWSLSNPAANDLYGSRISSSPLCKCVDWIFLSSMLLEVYAFPGIPLVMTISQSILLLISCLISQRSTITALNTLTLGLSRFPRFGHTFHIYPGYPSSKWTKIIPQPSKAHKYQVFLSATFDLYISQAKIIPFSQ